MERAKQLLAGIKNEGMDSVEIDTELRESSRVAKAILYGPEELSAGPEIEAESEIIVVEGRADVLNLLRYGIKNVIGMQGTKFPKTISKLSETKEVTLFVDGDRGGKLIAQNVFDNAKVEYIAVAPDGKEVEELSGKEIHQALRRKVKASDFFMKLSEFTPKNNDFEKVSRRNLTSLDITKLRSLASEIKGKNVLVLDEDLRVIQNVPASRVLSLNTKDAFVLMTTTATGTIINGAEKLNAKAVAAKTFGKIPESKVELISL